MLGPEVVIDNIWVGEYDNQENDELFGIIPRALDEVYERVDNPNDPSTQYEIKISYLEIYNESVNNLISEMGPTWDLDIWEDSNGKIHIPGNKP